MGGGLVLVCAGTVGCLGLGVLGLGFFLFVVMFMICIVFAIS